MSTPYRLQPSPFIVPKCREPLTILLSHEHFLAINKPSGLLTVPGRDPRNSDSVLTRLRLNYPTATIVHRLDMDTSGLLLIALSPPATSALGKCFEQRQIEKRYEAIVHGEMPAVGGHIHAPLITDWPNRPLQKVCQASGKPSHTEYQLLQQRPSALAEPLLQQSRLALTPHTGRSHQLRLHLAHIGHPIIGDAFYAPEAVCAAAPRLLLHASELSFINPFDNQPIALNCPCPF